MEYLYKSCVISEENVVYDYTSPTYVDGWTEKADLAYIAKIRDIIEEACPEVLEVWFLDSIGAPGNSRIHGVMDENTISDIETKIMELDLNHFVEVE